MAPHVAQAKGATPPSDSPGQRSERRGEAVALLDTRILREAPNLAEGRDAIDEALPLVAAHGASVAAATTFGDNGRAMRVLIALLALPLALGACTTERPRLVGPDILFVATPELVGVEMLRLAGVNAGDVVYDLGSGDGRLVIAAAREFGARGVGVEIEAALVQTSRESAAKAGVADRVRFLWQDLFATDLADATVVTLYLRDDVNLRLRPRLLGALRPGARVVSHDFGMADWTPDRVHRVRGPAREHTLYLWLVPAGVDGTWEAMLGTGGGARRARLELRQRFQELSGLLEIDARRLPLRGTVAGTAIEVTAEGWVFSGRVAGDRAAGRAAERGRPPLDWEARRAPGG